MKRFFLLLLATSLMMTVIVACGDDNKKDGDKTNGASDKAPTASSEGNAVGVNSSGGLTSDELDAWGNVSIDIEVTSKDEGSASSNEQPSKEQTSTNSEAVSSKTESQSGTSSKNQTSNDKDEGFGDWAPIG